MEGLVVRVSDWSETSRIVTLFTREHGKLRALAKGGRRLRSPFESSLDLLNHDRMVLIRKTSGGLHLLTESSQITRFSGLAKDYQALSGAYLVAELLGDWVEENDPHPGLFDAAIGCLKDLEQAACADGETEKGVPKWNPRDRLVVLELALLIDLGYRPEFAGCVGCAKKAEKGSAAFAFGSGGLVCRGCRLDQRGWRELPERCWKLARNLVAAIELGGNGWAELSVSEESARREVRRWLGEYLSWIRGRRPRLMGWQEE
jgi:DNA repair protein RecO (recombination protein O)